MIFFFDKFTLKGKTMVEIFTLARMFFRKVRKRLIAVPPEQLMKVGYLKEQAQ